MEEIFVVIHVANDNEFLKVPILNAFDWSIMDFCHSVPKFQEPIYDPWE